MSNANAAADPSRKRRLRSWASSDADDESTAAAAAPDSPAAFAAVSASAAQSSDAALGRKKARRQQLLAAAFGDQPPPSRWSDLSPAQRCFSDGLALAFSFLSLFELIPAALTCRSWREAAENASVAGVEVRNPLSWPGSLGMRSSSRLLSLASSPFRRYVHVLTHSDARTKQTNPRPTWELPDLRKLQRLPQLRRISGMSIELYSLRVPFSARTFFFPPLLESVDLHLSSDPSELDEDEDDWSTESVQRLVLGALQPCHSLTELSLTILPYVSLSLDGLLELAALQILTIDIEYADGEMDQGDIHSMFTEEQMGVVKRLPNLRRLKLIECDLLDPDEDDLFGTRWLRWLCPLPHRLQRLEELDLSQLCLHLEQMQLLDRLPALTALEPDTVYESALPLLPSFATRLKRLRLDAAILGDDEEAPPPELFDFETQLVRAPLFLQHLTPCTALTHLTLHECVFSEADATALCQALTHLRDLDLDDVGWPSFESLRHLPQLETLSLRRVKTAIHPLTLDAAHFRPLQQLRDLTLIGVGVGAQPLSDAVTSVIDALRPPSALLPALVDFCFSP